MNYTELSKRIHAANVAKGFWPKEGRDMGEVFALIHSEASEALKAHRDDLPMDVPPQAWVAWERQKDFGSAFVVGVYRAWFKDRCVAEELADVAIRTLDLLGYFECDFKRTGEDPAMPDAMSFGGVVSVIHIFVAEANKALICDDMEECIRKLIGVLALVEATCTRFGINLQAHIEAKLAYNSTRPFKHGKKY